MSVPEALKKCPDCGFWMFPTKKIRTEGWTITHKCPRCGYVHRDPAGEPPTKEKKR